MPTTLDQLQNRIDYAEQRINEIVYELYGLTKDEMHLLKMRKANKSKRPYA